MTRGRKGLPVQIHKLRGTFRPDRHNADAPAPRPALSLPPRTSTRQESKNIGGPGNSCFECGH